MPLHAKRFDSLPPELDGFRAETWVGSAVRRNRVKPTDQKDHHVYLRNWGADEVNTEVSAKAECPRLVYVDLKDQCCWPVDVPSVSSDEEITKVEKLRHDGMSCSVGNQHRVVLEGKFGSRLPGAPEYVGKIILVLRCN